MAVTVRTAASTRADGSFAIDGEPSALAVRRRALAPHPWTWLHQVHGSEVVVVTAPGEHAGAEGDALVTTVPGAVLAVQTADCAPVLLWDEEAGVVGAAHAGWRGLLAGVVQHTVAAMRGVGAERPVAAVGPCICGACYDFGAADLARIEARYPGHPLRATTKAGGPALDLAALVTAALGEVDVVVVAGPPGCTAEDPARWFSHRARVDVGRMAAAIWLEEG